MDSTDSGLEIIIPPNYQATAQAHPAPLGKHVEAQLGGGFMSSLFSVIGLNISTVIAVGTKVVQDVLAFVGGQPIFDRVKGIKIGGRKVAVWIAITDNDAGPPTWPAG